MNVFILYKTVRIETSEYYIGIHGIDTDMYPRFNDPYLGSGDRILASVKKYGRKAFVRSILSISESRKEAEALEAAIVTVEMIADPLCLNLAPGGRGGVGKISKSVEHRQTLSDSMKGVPKTPEHCQAISDSRKGKSHSVESRRVMSDAKKGIPKSAEHRQAISDALRGVPGHKHSVETRQAMSDARKEWWRQRKLKSKPNQ